MECVAGAGQPGKGALVRSSGWPVLALANGSRVRLDALAGEQTVRTTRLYTFLVVNFAVPGTSRDKVPLLPRRHGSHDPSVRLAPADAASRSVNNNSRFV